jgi:ribosomal protein S12 methylthiotransferase accessory factor
VEAIERVSAEPPVPGPTRTASFDELVADRTDVVDPVTLTLPSDTTYRSDRPFTWVESHDLVTGRAVWTAADLVTSPPSEGILHEVDTNGLGAGNSLLEATVHGLCEAIERDAWSQHEFVALFGDDGGPSPPWRGIDQGSLPDAAAAWVDRIRGAGLGLALSDVTTELGVPTIQALLTDTDHPSAEGPRTMHFQGFGAHPTAATALLGAISEAVQGRLAVIQGARDSYNVSPASTRRFTERYRAAQLVPRADVAFDDIPSVRHDDLLDDLGFLLDRLERAGFESAVVTDLTRAHLGVPVVRVRVPRLSGFVVNRRRVDWRCLRHVL